MTVWYILGSLYVCCLLCCPFPKATAAGILAVTYQAAHCAGLLMGIGIVITFLGGF